MARKTRHAAETENKILAQRLRETFGDEILQETADRLGNISKSSVGFWKQGQANPDYDMLARIAEVYDVTTDWLLGREGAVKTPAADLEATCRYLGITEKAALNLKAAGRIPAGRSLDRFLESNGLLFLINSIDEISEQVAAIEPVMEETENIIKERDKEELSGSGKLQEALARLDESYRSIRLSRYELTEAADECAEEIFGIRYILKRAGDLLLDARETQNSQKMDDLYTEFIN